MDLIDAITTDNKNKVFELLFGGANVFVCDDLDNITPPLHHAISAARIEIIFMLIEFGADPYEKCSCSIQNAFELACSLSRYDVINLLLNFSASKHAH